MKKSLVALAVAGAFAAPLTAQADVAISGNVNLKLNLSSQDGDTKKNANVSSGDVRVNFAAQQDVGFGEVFGNIRLDADGLSGAAPTADSVYAGIRGDYGTVTVGDHSVHGNYAGYNWFDTMIGYSNAALVYEAPEFVPGLSIGLQLIGTTYAEKSVIIVDQEQLDKNVVVLREKIIEMLKEDADTTVRDITYPSTQNTTATDRPAVAAIAATAATKDAEFIPATYAIAKVPAFETLEQFETRRENFYVARLEEVIKTTAYMTRQEAILKQTNEKSGSVLYAVQYDTFKKALTGSVVELRKKEDAYSKLVTLYANAQRKLKEDRLKTAATGLAEATKQKNALAENVALNSVQYTVDTNFGIANPTKQNLDVVMQGYLNAYNTAKSDYDDDIEKKEKASKDMEDATQEMHHYINIIKAFDTQSDEFAGKSLTANRPTKTKEYNEKTETTAFAIGYTSDLGTAGVVKLAYSQATQKVSDEDSHGKQTNESENHIGVGYSNMGFGIAYDQLTKKTKEDSVSKADTKTTEITLSYATGPVSVNLVSATQKQEAVKETKATVINIDYTLAANTSIRLRNVTSPVTDLAKNTEVKNNSTFIELRQSF